MGQVGLLVPMEGLVAHSSGGEQVRAGPWEHRPAATAHSIPCCIVPHCARPCFTPYSSPAHGCLSPQCNTTPHWWPPAGPLPSTFNQCSTSLFPFATLWNNCIVESTMWIAFVWSVDQLANCREVCPSIIWTIFLLS